MSYLVSFFIVVLISVVGNCYIITTKRNEVKINYRSMLLTVGIPIGSFAFCSLLYKITCLFTVSHNNFLLLLSLIICTLSEIFAVNILLNNRNITIVRHLFILSLVLSLFETFLFNYTSITTNPKMQYIDISTIQSDGTVSYEEDSLIISADSSLTIDEPPADTSAIIINQQQSHGKFINPIEVSLLIKDGSLSQSFETVRDRLTPATGKPLVMSIMPYKKLYSVKINYTGVTEPLTIHSVQSANAVPFSFSFLRYLVLFAIVGFIILVREKNWSYILYHPNNFRQNLILQGIILICTAAAFLYLIPEKVVSYDPNVPNVSDPFALMFDAFQKKQLYLDLDADPNLLSLENVYDRSLRDASGVFSYWDLALYNGHYYSYFGVAPVLTLYYPFYLISGKLPTVSFASFIFCILAIFFFCQLVITIVNRLVRHCNFLLLCLAIPTSAACCGVFYVLNMSNIYTLPLSAGLCFLFLCLWFGLKATMYERKSLRILLLILSGVTLSLCAMSRPGMALGSLILTPFYLQILLSEKNSLRSKLSQACAFLVPVLFGAAFILIYNYKRFGDIFDFGQTYQLTVNDIHANNLSFISFFPMLIHYFLQLPRTRALFPYFEANYFITYNYGKFTYLADTIGAFTYSIIPAGLLLTPSICRRTHLRFSVKKWFLIISFCISLLIAWQDFCLGGSVTRYVIDFLPLLVLLSIVVLLSAVDIDHGTKTKTRICVLLFTSSFLVSFLLTIGVRDGILMKFHGELYETVEDLFIFWK